MGGFWNFFLFQIFPYIAIFIFLLGCVLRFDRDPYSWRTKSSQLLRRKQLILGSVLFHLGILVILAGHAVGLLTPIQVFDAIGISHGAKQVLAITAGGIAGIFCLIGLLLLLHRRLYDPRIRKNSSFADIAVAVQKGHVESKPQRVFVRQRVQIGHRRDRKRVTAEPKPQPGVVRQLSF